MKIRKTEHKDIKKITKIIKNSYKSVADKFNLTPENCPKHPSNCDEEWIHNDFHRGVVYFLLDYNNFSTGCVAIEKISSELFYLERLSVLPEYRRNGLGKELVNFAINKADESGINNIGIGIISKDEQLKMWYKKMGFIEGETKKFDHLPFLVTFLTYKIK